MRRLQVYVDFALMSLTVADDSPPRPALNIVQIDTATIQLSWPTNALGYALQFATNLQAHAWSPTTHSVVTNGDIFSVTEDITGAKRFYRLVK